MKDCDRILGYLIELSGGECSVTEELIEKEPNEGIRQIMAGVMHLHDEIQFKEKLVVEREKQEYVDRLISQLSHEINNPLTIAMLHTQKKCDEQSREKTINALNRISEIVKRMEELLSVKGSEEALGRFRITGE
jgi:nitrogen-specific signal transduction histidine kinase